MRSQGAADTKEAVPELPLDLSILEGKTVNKLGKIVDDKVYPLLFPLA
jgi:hypothetical protein